MTAAVAGVGQQARQLPRQQLLRAAIASTVGTTLIWYDLFLYGFAAMLLLGDRFLPAGAAFAGTVTVLATYLVGFLARPLGAALFGRLGDRIGRRATLIATLWLMGVATTLVGLVPTYAQIGILGAILLTLLRIVQGMAAGGEWAGSVLLSVEWGERRRRGLIGSLTQLAMPAGLLLAFGALQLSVFWLGRDSYWSWRVPFLASVALVVAGLYARLGTRETPVFTELLEQRKIEYAPLAQTFAKHWREVVLCALARTGQEAPFYLFTVFVVAYATDRLGFRQGDVLDFVLIAAAISLATTPLWGYVSDRLGRKRLYLIGATVMLLWAYPYWALLDTRVQLLAFGAIVLALPIHDLQNGPQAALIVESFTARLRYTGASLGYNLAALTAGGPALVLPIALLNAFHSSMALAIYTGVCAAVSLAAVALLRDGSDRDMST